MGDELAITLLRLRSAVGCAAETSTPPWWSTQFFTEQSDSFLHPIFPRSHWAARVHAVTKCAAKLHDERIGINQHVFHLFRLPEFLELQLASAATSPDAESLFQPLIIDPAKATAMLSELAATGGKAEPGPVRIGEIDSLLSGDAIPAIAATYSLAFTKSHQAFPYLTEAR